MSTSEKTLHDDLLIGLSRRLATAINAQPFHCAINAWRALIAFPDLFRDGGRLVEGWFVIETAQCVVMNEHLWCELADGHIVDPSILLLVPETTPVFYFPGLRREYAETEALEGELFPHVRFEGYGDDGLGHAGYNAAREAARRKVYALATRVRPPKGMQFLTAQDLDGVLPPEPTERVAPPPIGEQAPLNIRLSLVTAQELPACLGQCWYNARDAMLRMPQEFLAADYVEGWLLGQWKDAIRLTEHGWIETLQSGIVDPTIVLKSALPQRLSYIPGLRLSWSQLQASATCHFPLARRYPFGERLSDYRESCQIALEKGEHLAWQTGLPLFAEPGGVMTFRGRGSALMEMEEVIWDFPVPPSPSAQVAAMLREVEKGAEKQ